MDFYEETKYFAVYLYPSALQSFCCIVQFWNMIFFGAVALQQKQMKALRRLGLWLHCHNSCLLLLWTALAVNLPPLFIQKLSVCFHGSVPTSSQVMQSWIHKTSVRKSDPKDEQINVWTAIPLPSWTEVLKITRKQRTGCLHDIPSVSRLWFETKWTSYLLFCAQSYPMQLLSKHALSSNSQTFLHKIAQLVQEVTTCKWDIAEYLTFS